jgi:hypothetical protein
VIGGLVRFWRSDRGLSIFSAFLLVFVFVLPPFLPPATSRPVAADVVFALVLVSGVLALSERAFARGLLMAAALVVVGVLVVSWMISVPEPVVRVAELASVFLLLVVVLGQTFRQGPVTAHRIQGGIAAYLLLGVMWASAYALVDSLVPGAFSGALGTAGGHRGWMYFSFVTLTTVGYGDILPVHPAARSLAMLEAVTGPLYVAILLARLVSLAVTPTPAGDGGEGQGRPRRGGDAP